MSSEIKVSLNHLEELISLEGKKTVGHVMRKFDVVKDESVLKELTKDAIYEGFRNFRDMILAYGMGKEKLYIKFDKTDKS